LPLSFPENLHSNPTYLSFGSEGGRVLYSEDVFVGYRWYDKVRVPPQFRFGHGLSYTSFQLSSVAISQSDEGKSIKEEVVVASASVENTGTRAGAEVVQFYVLPPQNSRVGRPLKELKGFQKVMLQPGEKKQVTIVVPKTLATSYWDEPHAAWLSEAGDYGVSVVGTGNNNSFPGKFKVPKSRHWNGL
jgi:beta-glucosidase